MKIKVCENGREKRRKTKRNNDECSTKNELNDVRKKTTIYFIPNHSGKDESSSRKVFRVRKNVFSILSNFVVIARTEYRKNTELFKSCLSYKNYEIEFQQE